MSATRASKRRKLDNEALPTSEVATAAVQHETPTRTPRANGRGRAAEVNGTSTAGDEGGSGHANGEAADTTQSGGRARTTRRTPRATEDMQQVAAAPEPAAKITPARAKARQAPLTASLAKASPAAQHVQSEDGMDIDMIDADSTRGIGSVNGENTRASGRKRQPSKKLEESASLNGSRAGSPRINGTRKTPASATRKRQATPLSIPLSSLRTARRGTKGSARKQQSSKSEIPDSEPEDGQRDGTSGEAAGKVTRDSIHVASLSPQPITPSKPSRHKAPVIATDTTATPIKNGLKSKNSAQDQLHSTPVGSRVLNPIDALFRPQGDVESFESTALEGVQLAVLAQLMRRSPSRLVALEQETRKISSVVTQAITAGESNSMVVIGARGSGKTAVIESILAAHYKQYQDVFHVVRLNGFIHTDDKIAIREIWRQLGREMEIEEDSSVKNYADTMTTLLALLSHPSEIGQEQDGHISKSVIIILDEFDLFTTHPRQTLLYNLFDIAQSRKAPLAVLGLTTRYDVAEALEKRVKSRFSHRQIYLPLARSFASYKDMCKSSLHLSGASSADMPTIATWNATIDDWFDTSTILNDHLQRHYHTTKSVPAFQTSLLFPLTTLPSSASTLQSPATIRAHLDRHLTLAPSLQPPDNILVALPSLSTLELSLLVAAARLVIIHDSDNVSFALAYDEYKSLASKAKIAASASGALAAGGARVWGAKMARAAWEGLGEKGFVVPVADVGGGGGPGRVEVSLEELGIVLESGVVDGVGAQMVKWCKEL